MHRCTVWLLACVALGVASRASAGAPNVVLIVVDTLRSDRVGAYGNTHGLTPVLDRLAERGTVFANAYAPSSWTCPSVASLFTSRYASQHGVIGFETPLADSEVTVAERLGEAGYVSGGFSANLRLSEEFGYGQGFQRWQAYMSRNEEDGLKPRGRVLRADSVAWIAKTMAKQPERPIMLYVQYLEPHAPYLPESTYRLRVNLPPTAGADEHTANSKLTALGIGDKHLTAHEVELLQSLYDGEVAAVDAEIGALLAELEAMGFLKNAVIIVSADHGEEFGEHGEFLHGITLFNPSIRIPLIVAGADVVAGRVVTDNVSLIDIAPTLVALAGLPAAPTFEGRSLVPLLRPSTLSERVVSYISRSIVGPRPPAGEVLSELERTDRRGLEFRAHARALIDGSEKLLVRPDGKTAVYDIAKDPGETTPLDGTADAARRTELLSRLERLSGNGKERADAGPGRPLDEATKEKLRALGYQP